MTNLLEFCKIRFSVYAQILQNKFRVCNLTPNPQKIQQDPSNLVARSFGFFWGNRAVPRRFCEGGLAEAKFNCGVWILYQRENAAKTLEISNVRKENLWLVFPSLENIRGFGRNKLKISFS